MPISKTSRPCCFFMRCCCRSTPAGWHNCAMLIPLRPIHNGRAAQGIGRGFEIVARRDNVSSMVNGEGLDVRIVTSTGADSYALGYSEAEFRRLKFQGEYLRDFTADVSRRAGIAPGMRVLDIGCGVGDVSLLVAEMVSSWGTVLGLDRSAQAVALARQRA